MYYPLEHTPTTTTNTTKTPDNIIAVQLLRRKRVKRFFLGGSIPGQRCFSVNIL